MICLVTQAALYKKELEELENTGALEGPLEIISHLVNEKTGTQKSHGILAKTISISS